MLLLLSEDPLGSDRFTAFATLTVRRSLGFGQVYSFCYSYCPKIPWVRTGLQFLLLLLSEDPLGSDRFTAFATLTVRRSLRFGQVYSFCYSYCPNMHGVRTLILLFLLKLSEHARGSDRFTTFATLTVRRFLGFGQVYCFCYSYCPKIPWVRTGLLLLLLLLSEDSLGSDRFTAFATLTVRRSLGFGQVYSFCYSYCPNMHEVRTGLLLLLLLLSEDSLGSDRFTAFATLTVRTCPRFGLLYCFFSSNCPNMPKVRTLILLFLLKLKTHEISCLKPHAPLCHLIVYTSEINPLFIHTQDYFFRSYVKNVCS
ncbi:hypothetical protein HNQ41_001717 [Texcoconibacillus texcoconensis]|uniref:Uncharacterized protein n=1 Tax=Texcoconibacillus texcoconensis TaxID=1095777 RepID=A0A840QQ91_9BACI|nr:hypothetical protein [Texcoconibacillus texcoconensis]